MLGLTLVGLVPHFLLCGIVARQSHIGPEVTKNTGHHMSLMPVTVEALVGEITYQIEATQYDGGWLQLEPYRCKNNKSLNRTTRSTLCI